MSKVIKYGTFAALGLALAVGGAPVIPSAKAADFYEGRTITILIGYGFGGTYGKYARIMSKHLPKHLAGSPNLIVQSMPGAGGLKAVNYAYNVLPRQGLHFIEPAD